MEKALDFSRMFFTLRKNGLDQIGLDWITGVGQNKGSLVRHS